MLGQILDVTAVLLQTTFSPQIFVVLTVKLGESPFLGNINLKSKVKNKLVLKNLLKSVRDFFDEGFQRVTFTHFCYLSTVDSNMKEQLIHISLKLQRRLIKSMTYLLATRELELGTPKSFNDGILMPVISPDGHQRLSDLDTSDGSLGFAKGASHSGLEPIGTSARQHFVDTQDMERMDTDPDVELILSSVLDHVLKLVIRNRERL